MPNRRCSLVAGRLLVAVGIGLACSIAAPLSCHAQTLGGVTPLAGHAGPSPRPASAEPISSPQGVRDLAGLGRPDATSNIVASRLKFQYLAPLGGLILGYVGGTIDHDAGGYRDSFKVQPDKQAHLLASVVLAKAVADGTSVKVGLATCLLAGAAWEAGQRRHHGYASGFDFTYDSVGCLAGALWGRK